MNFFAELFVRNIAKKQKRMYNIHLIMNCKKMQKIIL